MSLVYVWMWGVWGLGSGDENMIELDTLQDTSLLPVQKWVLTTLVSPLVEASARDLVGNPGRETLTP